MKIIDVYTQQELDAALAGGDTDAVIICRGMAEASVYPAAPALIEVQP